MKSFIIVLAFVAGVDALMPAVPLGYTIPDLVDPTKMCKPEDHHDHDIT
jgi:hypothetical protein